MSNLASIGECHKWQNGRGNVFVDRSGFKSGSLLLILYICLLPVSTALAGKISKAVEQRSVVQIEFLLTRIAGMLTL